MDHSYKDYAPDDGNRMQRRKFLFFLTMFWHLKEFGCSGGLDEWRGD
jgi:hypothetical protein